MRSICLLLLCLLGTLAAGQEKGGWLLRFGSRYLWQVSRKDVRTRIWLPLWPLAHMSLNLAVTLLGFGFCPSQPSHSFNKHLLSTFYVPFVIVVQSLSHVLVFVTPWTAAYLSFLVLHYLPEFAQTHVHWVIDAIQPSHPPSSLSPLALSLSQHQGLLQWAGSLYQVAVGLHGGGSLKRHFRPEKYLNSVT